MSFAQIYRAFKGHKQRMDDRAILTREIVYMLYATNKKNPEPKNVFWPIGEVTEDTVTQDYTDEIYRKYGKLRRHGKN